MLMITSWVVSAKLHYVAQAIFSWSCLSSLTMFSFCLTLCLLHENFKSSFLNLCARLLLAQVNARILFIDPSTRAVGLTLNPHLVHNKAPPSVC